MDGEQILEVISRTSQETLLTFDEVISANLTSVTLYDIPEWKKEFNIETARQCIIDISLAPYVGKHLYILRHFDSANIEAQNALLKILEDCPPYAVIILEVENPQNILETILSRTMNLVGITQTNTLSDEWKQIINLYRAWSHAELVSLLYGYKCTANEAITLLSELMPYLSGGKLIECQEAIENLSATYENPRNILDIFFLS